MALTIIVDVPKTVESIAAKLNCVWGVRQSYVANVILFIGVFLEADGSSGHIQRPFTGKEGRVTFRQNWRHRYFLSNPC